MLEGETFLNDHPLYITENIVLRSNFDGIIFPLIDKGLSISQGTVLGYTNEFWGNKIEEYISPFSGIVARTTSSPSVKKGEVVVRLARISDKYE